MPEPSTPRTWQTSDPEPPDDVEVLSKGNGWFLVRGRPGWFWSHVGYRSERPGYAWSSVSKVGLPGTLTEVLPPDAESLLAAYAESVTSALETDHA